ncbi:MAG: hypothetical protein ABEJ87_03535 [Candidatus Nanohalobium sp.]
MYVERSEAFDGFDFDNAVMEGSSQDELYLISHPGYCLVDDEYMDLGLRPEDHFGYSLDFFRELESKIEDDVTVALLEEARTGYSREFLGEDVESVDHFFQTVGGRARPTRDSAGEFIDVLRGLEDGGKVTVAGENNGLCVRQTGQITEYVSDAFDLDLEIRKGVVFPRRPVERPGDELMYVDR